MVGPLRDWAPSGGILIGVSAGAILMGPTIATDALFIGRRPEEITDGNALDLMPFEFFPHLRDEDTYLPDLLRYSTGTARPIVACNDGDGVVVAGGKIECVGNPLWISGGAVRAPGEIELGGFLDSVALSSRHSRWRYGMPRKTEQRKNKSRERGKKILRSRRVFAPTRPSQMPFVVYIAPARAASDISRSRCGSSRRRRRAFGAPSLPRFGRCDADVVQTLRVQFAQILQLPEPRARRSGEKEAKFPEHVEHPCFAADHARIVQGIDL